MTTVQRCHVVPAGRGENGPDSGLIAQTTKVVSMLQPYQVATACWQAAHTKIPLFRTSPSPSKFIRPTELNGARCKCDSCPTISGSQRGGADASALATNQTARSFRRNTKLRLGATYDTYAHICRTKQFLLLL